MIRIVLLALLLTLPANAQKVYVQWSLKNPQGWEEVGEWSRLPKQAFPSGDAIGGRDNKKGWVAAVRIGDHVLVGYDFYSVERNGGKVIFHGWIDDPTDRIRGKAKIAERCVFPEGKCEVIPWHKFKRPRHARYGVWLPLDLWVEHRKLQVVE